MKIYLWTQNNLPCKHIECDHSGKRFLTQFQHHTVTVRLYDCKILTIPGFAEEVTSLSVADGAAARTVTPILKIVDEGTVYALLLALVPCPF